MNHGLLSGKTVLLTAAAGTGIGFATARRALEEGARICISDRSEARTAEAARQLSELSGQPVAHVVCDVTVQEQVDGMVLHALGELGHIDVLVNNAGLGGTAELHQMSDAQWDKVLDVTLTGTMRVTRSVISHMYSRNTGCIVNNASVLGWRAQRGQSHYAAAKAGVMAFTRCVAVEAAEHGVRVNAVAPSLVMHAFLHKVTSEELLTELEGKEAFGRSATPEEVANVILFLASGLSSYMTGEVISVSSQRA